MISIPKNALAVAKAAAKETGRCAMNSIRIIECKDDWYQLLATDGKLLCILCGPGDVPDPMPTRWGVDPKAVADAPNGRNDYLVGLKDFEEALKSIKAKDGRVVVVGSDECVTFFSEGAIRRRELVPGQFPHIDAVMPKTAPLLKIPFNPHILERLCDIARQFVDKGSERAEFLYYGKGKPLGFMCKNSEGLTLDGLIMPLGEHQEEKPKPKKEPAPAEEEEEDDDEGDDEAELVLSYKCPDCNHEWQEGMSLEQHDRKRERNCPACKLDDVEPLDDAYDCDE